MTKTLLGALHVSLLLVVTVNASKERHRTGTHASQERRRTHAAQERRTHAANERHRTHAEIKCAGYCLDGDSWRPCPMTVRIRLDVPFHEEQVPQTVSSRLRIFTATQLSNAKKEMIQTWIKYDPDQDPNKLKQDANDHFKFKSVIYRANNGWVVLCQNHHRIYELSTVQTSYEDGHTIKRVFSKKDDPRAHTDKCMEYMGTLAHPDKDFTYIWYHYPRTDVNIVLDTAMEESEASETRTSVSDRLHSEPAPPVAVAATQVPVPVPVPAAVDVQHDCDTSDPETPCCCWRPWR